MNKFGRRMALLLLLLAALLAGALSGGIAAGMPAEREAEAAAWDLYSLGLFQGTGTDAAGQPVFELDRAPTRHEAVTMLVRLLGREQEALSGDWSLPFQDVAAWARPYVGCAYAAGLTNGTSAETYGGDAPVTASQYLTFVLRCLGYDSGTDFAWDRAWELSDRLGVTDGRYGPGSGFTRGDVAIVSRNALSACLRDSGVTLFDACHGNARYGLSAPLEVHFIDVGQADAALVVCEGRAMLIDGGNVADSSRIYAYLQRHNLDRLDLVVCSHPHEDHVGGLAGALNYATAGAAWCSVTEYDSAAFRSFLKYLAAQDVTLTVPRPGDRFSLGRAEVEVLGPLDTGGSVNNNSLVLRLRYGAVSFLFTGDAEREEELALVEAEAALKCTVLKVPHHGSATSSTYPFLYCAEPEYAVISVGKKNSYGHPDGEVLRRLRDADAEVYRTDTDGDIIFRSDGRSLTVQTGGDAVPAVNTDPAGPAGPAATDPPEPPAEEAAETPPAEEAVRTYILNTNSRKFHDPACDSVRRMSEKNKRVYQGPRDEILAMGYEPCQNCNP